MDWERAILEAYEEGTDIHKRALHWYAASVTVGGKPREMVSCICTKQRSTNYPRSVALPIPNNEDEISCSRPCQGVIVVCISNCGQIGNIFRAMSLDFLRI